MGIGKTALGIFLGVVAFESFKALGNSDDLGEALTTTAIGSVTGAASVHLLKNEIAEAANSISDNERRLLSEDYDY